MEEKALLANQLLLPKKYFCATGITTLYKYMSRLDHPMIELYQVSQISEERPNIIGRGIVHVPRRSDGEVGIG
jgi:hypothetical protein